MITFGLTGGIASGKSTVTKVFRQYDIPIVDADIIARQVVEPGTEGLKQIVSDFGDEYLTSDGQLNRPKLGKLVFESKIAYIKLMNIMTLLIKSESEYQINKLHTVYPLVGYDAALIIEMGNAEKYRPLILVSCPKEIQLSRLMSRNNLSKDEALSRINAQLSLDVKTKYADYIIDTSGSIDDSKIQTFSIIQDLRKLYRKRE